MPKQSHLVFKLTSENVTNVGLSMGSADSYVNWTRLFTSMEAAKRYAEADYCRQKKDSKAQIKWTRGTAICSSGDLGFVMYGLNREVVFE